MPGRPRQFVAALIAILAAAFTISYIAYVLTTVSGTDLTLVSWTLVAGKTAAEVIAGIYGIAFLVFAGAFVVIRDERAAAAPMSDSLPSVAMIYLCCDDADWSALESFTKLSYEGPLRIVIHDDSHDAAARTAVDRMAARLRAARCWDVAVLRRPERTGGKAGAVNYTLERTAHTYDYFLLCDNDSTVLDPDTIQRALGHMDSPDVAGVQCRNVAAFDPAYCAANRRLAESIGAFHVFLAPAARFGWLPFVGHNALLRTDAVQRVGGLTPGFFADDLDLTVRLNLAGYRIAYAADVAMGEKHPPSYTAFRKRSYKWAYGCVQTLRAHSWHVLRSPRFSFAQKLSFFQFAGFYCLQSVLLAYLCFALLIAPLGAVDAFVPDRDASVLIGLALLGTVYAPLLAFFARTATARKRGWLVTVGLCGLVYGGTDFSVVRGVVDALWKRRRAWIPTNGVAAAAVDPALFAEAAFGLALLAVPILYVPELLYFPCWFVFAGKFLFGPALSLIYRDFSDDAPATHRVDRAAGVVPFGGTDGTRLEHAS